MATAPIAHHKRGTILPITNSATGRFVGTRPALERFVSYCRFDPTTGCVLWVGGVGKGHGHHAPYGVFWYDRARWWAHRWAAKFVHGQDIDGGVQVDHCCEADRAGAGLWLPPNTLCVQHVQALTGSENRNLQDERRNFILMQKGFYEPPPSTAELEAPMAGSAPFYEPPQWLLDASVTSAQDGALIVE